MSCSTKNSQGRLEIRRIRHLDFGAAHSTVPSAKAGLDLEMPTGIYFGDALKRAVTAGELPESQLDESWCAALEP